MHILVHNPTVLWINHSSLIIHAKSCILVWIIYPRLHLCFQFSELFYNSKYSAFLIKRLNHACASIIIFLTHYYIEANIYCMITNISVYLLKNVCSPMSLIFKWYLSNLSSFTFSEYILKWTIMGHTYEELKNLKNITSWESNYKISVK